MGHPGSIAVVEKRFPIAFAGHWPPDVSSLSGLGFDSVSVSKGSVIIRKTQSAGMAGRPHLFCEITLGKKECALRWSVPRESDEGIRQLQSSLLLLRALSILPSAQADAPQLASLLLPPLEAASRISTADYELLSKKCEDFRRQHGELSSKNARLSSSSEESAALLLEQSRTIAALESRIKKLEAVSDPALRELVLEWVSSHRGSFNAAAFSAANNIAPSRAEEGLETLLQSGALRRIGGSFLASGQETRGQYAQQKQGLFASLGNHAKKITSGARLALPSKKEF